MYTSIVNLDRSNLALSALAKETAVYNAPPIKINEAPINDLQENILVNTPQINPTFSDIKIKENIIIADLTNMKLTLLLEGENYKTFDIVSKGKPGSYYETPSGNYELSTKQDVRLSGLGNVYMPYAMQFFGNFFIHGIPYHANGERVTTAYSGGCIRMNDIDAKEIYDFAKIGTKIIIKTDANISENIDMNIETSKNMLTSLVSLEIVNQEKLVTFNKEKIKIKIKDLNYYIINGNEEAINIVQSQIGGELFNEYREKKARAIGINNLNFENVNDRVLFYNFIKTNKSYLLQFI
jgi:lipoprotein-anchoring transpeptidase ErfK/SrfK